MDSWSAIRFYMRRVWEGDHNTAKCIGHTSNLVYHTFLLGFLGTIVSIKKIRVEHIPCTQRYGASAACFRSSSAWEQMVFIQILFVCVFRCGRIRYHRKTQRIYKANAQRMPTNRLNCGIRYLNYNLLFIHLFSSYQILNGAVATHVGSLSSSWSSSCPLWFVSISFFSCPFCWALGPCTPSMRTQPQIEWFLFPCPQSKNQSQRTEKRLKDIHLFVVVGEKDGTRTMFSQMLSSLFRTMHYHFWFLRRRKNGTILKPIWRAICSIRNHICTAIGWNAMEKRINKLCTHGSHVLV